MAPDDHKIARRLSEALWAKDFNRRFHTGQRELKARLRQLNRAVRRDGRRIARDHIG